MIEINAMSWFFPAKGFFLVKFWQIYIEDHAVFWGQEGGTGQGGAIPTVLGAQGLTSCPWLSTRSPIRVNWNFKCTLPRPHLPIPLFGLLWGSGICIFKNLPWVALKCSLGELSSGLIDHPDQLGSLGNGITAQQPLGYPDLIYIYLAS